MKAFAQSIHYLLPLFGLIFLFLGIWQKRINYAMLALWLSLIALLIHYQVAGGEILGSYFDYQNTTIYSINLFVLIASLVYLSILISMSFSKKFTYLIVLLTGCITTGAIVLMANLWINAYFIENRLPGTAIMQVMTTTPPSYCSYRYVFYRVGKNAKISYLCPNHYWLIPSIGELNVTPDFILGQLKNSSPRSKN